MHDIAEVQKDITRIDEILMFMEEIAVGDQMKMSQTQGQVEDAKSASQIGADPAQAAPVEETKAEP